MSHAMILEGPILKRIWLWQRGWPRRRFAPPRGSVLRRLPGLPEGFGTAATQISPFTAVGGSRSFQMEEVRQIRDSASVMPNEAQTKVYILDRADNMTEQAQNALLKVLEEPPAHVMFLLTCTAASSLLPTVRSRRRFFIPRGGQPGAQEQRGFYAGGKHGEGGPFRQGV